MTTELGKPVAVFTATRAVSIDGHVWEELVFNVTLASTILSHLKEITRALCALCSTRAQPATCDLTWLALIAFRIVSIYALCAARVATSLHCTVGNRATIDDLIVLVKVVTIEHDQTLGLCKAVRIDKAIAAVLLDIPGAIYDRRHCVVQLLLNSRKSNIQGITFQYCSLIVLD